jgi:hypothetical protein
MKTLSVTDNRSTISHRAWRCWYFTCVFLTCTYVTFNKRVPWHDFYPSACCISIHQRCRPPLLGLPKRDIGFWRSKLVWYILVNICCLRLEIFRMVSGPGQRSIIHQVLELCPTNKILWSSEVACYLQLYACNNQLSQLTDTGTPNLLHTLERSKDEKRLWIYAYRHTCICHAAITDSPPEGAIRICLL